MRRNERVVYRPARSGQHGLHSCPQLFAYQDGSMSRHSNEVSRRSSVVMKVCARLSANLNGRPISVSSHLTYIIPDVVHRLSPRLDEGHAARPVVNGEAGKRSEHARSRSCPRGSTGAAESCWRLRRKHEHALFVHAWIPLFSDGGIHGRSS